MDSSYEDEQSLSHKARILSKGRPISGCSAHGLRHVETNEASSSTATPRKEGR